MATWIDPETGDVYDLGDYSDYGGQVWADEPFYYDDWGTGSTADGDMAGLAPLYYDDWGTGSTADGGMAGSYPFVPSGDYSSPDRGFSLSGLINRLLGGTTSGTTSGTPSGGILGAVSKLFSGGTLTDADFRALGTGLGGLGNAVQAWGGADDTPRLPDWYVDRAVGALDAAQKLPAYSPYERKLWSDMNATERQGFTNPYAQTVLDDIETQRGVDRNTLNAKSAMTGAFGGSRNLIERDLLDRRYDKARQNAMFSAFDTARTGYGQDWDRGAKESQFGFAAPLEQQGAVAKTLAAVKPGQEKEATNAWDKLGYTLTGLGGAVAGRLF